MAKQIFHIFGHLNPSGEPTVYDTEYEQTKLFLCDTVADLPESGFTDMDFAFTKTTETFFIGSGGKWNGSHPVHSVFFTDTEGLNPNRLLGYGTWESIGSIESAWGWKRTA